MKQILLMAVYLWSVAGLPFNGPAAASFGITPLGPGLHLGFGSFAPVSDDASSVLEDRVAVATAAGMDVSRVMVDWAEVETAPGTIDLSLLNDQLARVPKNSHLLLTLGVTDVDHYAVPDDLLTSGTELALPLDDAEVIARYITVLDAVVPTVQADHSFFALSVANEPDDLLQDRPAEDVTALATFTNSISEYVASTYPELPVTVTISGPGIAFARGFVPELVAATDIAAFNWSCLDFETFLSTDTQAIAAAIDQLVTAADGRDIILQELSCASGYTDQQSFIGSTPEGQAAWFDQFFSAMEAEPQFRAAFVLDLVDWPADLAVSSTDFLRGEGLDEIADRYGEFLATWGLLTLDLTPKPAWQIFLDHLSA